MTSRPLPNRRKAKHILRTTLSVSGVSLYDLLGDERRPEFCRARGVASCLIYYDAGLSYRETADLVGYRCYSSVRRAVLRTREASSGSAVSVLMSRVLDAMNHDQAESVAPGVGGDATGASQKNAIVGYRPIDDMVGMA